MERESRWDSTGSLVLGGSLVFLKKSQDDKQIQAPSSSPRHSGSSSWSSSPGGKMVSSPLSWNLCLLGAKMYKVEMMLSIKWSQFLEQKVLKKAGVLPVLPF